MKVPFSPPDITEKEIEQVTELFMIAYQLQIPAHLTTHSAKS